MAHIHEKIDFTVAIFIVQEGKVLLIHHRKLDKWLPLGGHIELDEDPEQAALREAKEESGFEVELIGERPPITSPGTRALIAPRFLDIHRITGTHEHIGMIYWARPRNGKLTLAADEHHDIRWCAPGDLEKLSPPMSEAVKWYCLKAIAELAVQDGGFQISNRQPAIKNQMTHRQLKTGYFALAGMNSVATSYYFNYLFFFLRDHFGFGNRGNLWVTALSGFIYIFAAWQCGKFAARCGRVLSLKIGFLSLCAVMVGGALAPHSLVAQLVMVSLYNIVLLLTWPALEALVSERETQAGVLEMVGIYNCTWAASAALAFFTGGKLYDALGSGAVFWLPAGIFFSQFLVLLWLEKHHNAVLAATPMPPKPDPRSPRNSVRGQPVNPHTFLKMAWLANPFAYVAINTLFAVMPGVAEKLALSPTRVGLFCSVWLFGRLAAFVLLWRWRGWHYRFRWLLIAFLVLIAGLATILLAHQLWLVVLAQIFFGLATGVIYYSSLFYSMDVGEASSEHGGLHEAFIGAGVFLGPATGAAALTFAPQAPNAFIWAVSGLLVLGLGGLLWLRRQPAEQ